MAIFFSAMSSEPIIDDNVVTHVTCIANLNLLEDSVVTCDERTVLTVRDLSSIMSTYFSSK